jgi:hypothetical protein
MRNKNGRFIKGSRINLGKHHSLETKKKISEAKKKNPTKYWLGKKRGHLPQSWRDSISKANKGKKHSIKWGKNIAIGLKKSKKVAINILKLRGEKHPNWKGGLTPISLRIRHSIEYRLWREAIFARDNWTCQNCGRKGGDLEAHHLKGFALFPELRFALDNGVTLCKSCHELTKRRKR